MTLVALLIGTFWIFVGMKNLFTIAGLREQVRQVTRERDKAAAYIEAIRREADSHQPGGPLRQPGAILPVTPGHPYPVGQLLIVDQGGVITPVTGVPATRYVQLPPEPGDYDYRCAHGSVRCGICGN